MRPVHAWIIGLGLVALGVLIYVGRGAHQPGFGERGLVSRPRVAGKRRLELPPARAKARPVAAGVPSRLPATGPAPFSATVTPATAEAEPWRGGEEIARATIRTALEHAFQEHVSDRELSPSEYERLTDAVIRMRAARRELNTLPVSVENAETIRRLRAELAEALTEFQAVAGMDAVEFTRRVEPAVGLSNEENDAGDADASAELLSDYPPPE